MESGPCGIYAHAYSYYILSVYYNIHYVHLLIVIFQDEILLAAAVKGQVDIVKEALEKNVNINGQTLFVSYTLL